MTTKVRLDVTDGPTGSISTIELVDPNGGNTIDFDFVDELADAVRDIGPSTSCITITARGKNFCLGGDLAGFASATSPDDHVGTLAIRLHECLEALASLGVPIIVGVQGWSAGAGMSLALFGDILIAERSAKFRTAYGAVGLTPDGGMSWSLPRAVGRSVALDLFLTRRALGADEAHTLGAVSRVVDDGASADVVAELAALIAASSASAVRATRALVHEGLTSSFVDHLGAEARAIRKAAGGYDGREGVAAFLERRPAQFSTTTDESTDRKQSL
jgi:2-(1,2-epoxy-1,2-dihydrophenyl)acetyl-CoA isomerase